MPGSDASEAAWSMAPCVTRGVRMPAALRLARGLRAFEARQLAELRIGQRDAP